jgi:hypothetical protein
MRRLPLYLSVTMLLAYTVHGAPLQRKNAVEPPAHREQAASPKDNPKSPMAEETRKQQSVQPQQTPIKQKPDYTLWALIVNGVLTLITFAIAIAGIVQALAAKEGADIATNAQRSWIVERGVDDADLTEVWIPRITCHFKVFGNSPVRVVGAKFRFHLVKSRQKPETSLKEADLPRAPNYGDIDTLISNPQMGRVYAPGDEFSVVPMLDGLFFESGDLKAIESGEKFLCIYGFMSYRDAFSKSKTRETRFCYIHGERNSLSRDERQFIVGGPPAYNEVT